MGRLVVVSNRLPVTIEQGDDGFQYKGSSGGLVSALGSLKESVKFVWVGWPGFPVDESAESRMREELRSHHDCEPVFLPAKVSDGYYNGFANGVLWPVFHYIPRNIEYSEGDWDAYVQANQIFAKTLANILSAGDMLWIHDYHLMLLPMMIRELVEFDVQVGFFLHIPFPTSEVFRYLSTIGLDCARRLPHRGELLEGLLSSDVIGFHIHDYARHFLVACEVLLSAECSPTGVTWGGRRVGVVSIPIGIDQSMITQALGEKECDVYSKELTENYAGKKIILGIDRLDYIKGIPHKIAAFATFLDRHPEYIEKVVLIQVAIPTRSDVEKYKELKSLVDELIGRVNGKYGTPTYLPIVIMHQSVSKPLLAALYKTADVCLVTSLRDGMNLVALEYLYTKSNCGDGSLIISEFAGVASLLRSRLMINPWCVEEVAEAIHEIVSDTSGRRSDSKEDVSKYSAQAWASSFITELAAYQSQKPVQGTA